MIDFEKFASFIILTITDDHGVESSESRDNKDCFAKVK